MFKWLRKLKNKLIGRKREVYIKKSVYKYDGMDDSVVELLLDNVLERGIVKIISEYSRLKYYECNSCKKKFDELTIFFL